MLATIKLTAVVAFLSGGFGTVQGSGKIKEETRAVAAFTQVEVSHGIQATVSEGPKASVKLEGDDNLLPLIVLEVKDGVLSTEITGWKGLRPTKELRLTVVTPRLTRLEASGGSVVLADATSTEKLNVEASGGSRLAVKGIKAETVEVDVSGGSNVTLAGTTSELNVQMSGGATVAGAELASARTAVQGSGGSEATLQASSSFQGELSGGTTVAVKGNPGKREVDASGGAKVAYEVPASRAGKQL